MILSSALDRCASGSHIHSKIGYSTHLIWYSRLELPNWEIKIFLTLYSLIARLSKGRAAGGYDSTSPKWSQT